MSDEPNNIGDLNLDELPKLLEIYLDTEEGPSTVVSVHPQEFFAALYPDGMTNGDPGAWGIILCDTIRHIARAHRQALLRFGGDAGANAPEPPPEELMVERIVGVLVEEFKNNDLPNIKGETVLIPKDPDKQH